MAFTHHTYMLDFDGPINVNQVGVYAQTEYKVSDWGFLAAMRVDNHDYYGTNYLPKAAITKKLGAGNFRLTYGRGMAVPSIMNLKGYLFGGLVLGNGEGFTLSDGSKVDPLKVETINSSQSVEHMTEDVFQLLKYLKIEKASFVGFSMGGAISFEMAIQHPELVEKLVIINSGPDFNNPNDSGVDILAERTKIIKEFGFEPLAEKISNGMFPEEYQTEWREDFKKRIMSNDEDSYLLTFGELMKWGLGEKISVIEKPTLIITSDQDYTSVEYKKSYQQKMKNATLEIIQNSRHGVVLDGAEQLNSVLLNFLENG